MTKRKKLITALIVIAVVLAGVILFCSHLWAYFNACVTDCRNEAGYLCMFHDTKSEINQYIDYEMLSDEYKEAIPYEQYAGADTPEELIELFSEEIFHKYPEVTVSPDQTTHGYKRQPGGSVELNGQWYYIGHEIDFEPDFWTLDIKVVRWYTEIRKINEEDLPVLY